MMHWWVEHIISMQPGLVEDVSHLHSLQFSLTTFPSPTTCPLYSHLGSDTSTYPYSQLSGRRMVSGATPD